MTNALLTMIVLFQALTLAACIAFTVYLLRVSRVIRTFITPADAGQPSALALVWLAACRALVTEIRTSLMGMKSGEVRAEKAIQKAMIEDTVSDSPALALGLQAFPGLGKVFQKNPSLLTFALSKLAGNRDGGLTPEPVGAPASDGDGDYAQRLRSYGG